MKIELKNRVVGIAAGISVAITAPPVLAQTTWTGSAGDGLWSSGGNWSTNNAPTCGAFCDPILIDLAGPVSLTTANTIAGTVGGNLTLGNTTQSILTVGAGGILNTGNTNIGGTATGIGILNVENGGQWVNGSAAAGNFFRIGNSGTGILNIRTGGIVTVGNGGTGRLVLGYAAGSHGTINIGAEAGESAVAAGTFQAGNIFIRQGGGRVVFNHTNTDYTFGVTLVSDAAATSGALDFLAGTTIFTSNTSQFSGAATVGAGAKLILNTAGFGHQTNRNNTLQVDGSFATSNNTGARAAVTRTIYGDLLFGSDAVIEMGLGKPGADLASIAGSVGDLIIVTGKLKLDGTLNIYDIGDGAGSPGFNFGRYELFRYGTLDASSNFNILGAGSLPSGIPGTLQNDDGNKRIILVVEQALGSSAWWNGGTDGIWNNSAVSWSADASSEPPLFAWNDGTAIFNGDGGTVTVGEDVNFSEISFEANGYVIADGGGNVLGKPVDDEQNIVNLGVMNGVVGEIATGLGEARAGLRMRKYNGGTLILSSNDNAWTGGTSIEQGILQIGNGGTTGVLPGNVQNGGILSFNRSNSYTYGGIVSGGGEFRQIGTGTTVLTGTSTFTGALTVSAGTLQIGNGGTQGWIVDGRIDNPGASNEVFVPYDASIAAGGTLAFNRSDSITWRRKTTGAGSIVQRGGADSVLTLSGDLSGFTGSVLAESGLLNINSTSYTGAVTVGAGGFLGGSGRMGSVIVQSGGRLAPGNSIGTLTVAGNATFLAGSIFEVEANVAGQSDRLVVQGTANLNGNVVALGEGTGWRPRTDYLILTANTLVGTFEGAVEENFAFLDASLVHNAGAGTVTLWLDRNDIDFAGVGVTANQEAAGYALQSLTPAHPLFDRVFDLLETATDDQVQYALAALSGEMHASARNMLLDDSRLLRDAVLTQSYKHGMSAEESALWVQAIGHRGETEGDGTDTLKRDAVGILFGANYDVGESAVSLGWAAGYHTNASLKQDNLASEGDANNTHVALYGGYRAPMGWGARAGLGQTWHELDLHRTVSFPGQNESVKTGYDGESTQAFAEFDYVLQAGESKVSPFVSMAWSRLKMEGFEEADFQTPVGNTVALKSNGQTDDVTFASVGARAQLRMGAFELGGMLGYRRTLSGDDSGLQLSFVDGGSAFEVRGAPIARDSLITDIGFEFSASESVKLGASYNGLLASDAHDHAIQARLLWTLQ